MIAAFGGGLGIAWLAECDHRRRGEDRVRVLAAGGNVAVTQLAGRGVSGVHVQGDTFAILRQEVADAARGLRRSGADGH
ncbi:DUF6959 family protein [Actinoplanes italicus]